MMADYEEKIANQLARAHPGDFSSSRDGRLPNDYARSAARILSDVAVRPLVNVIEEALRRLDNGPDNGTAAYDSIGALLPAGGIECEEKVSDLITFLKVALAKARGEP
jgi:hypothetical protein